MENSDILKRNMKQFSVALILSLCLVIAALTIVVMVSMERRRGKIHDEIQVMKNEGLPVNPQDLQKRIVVLEAEIDDIKRELEEIRQKQ
jgi:hypothetical protein